MGTKATNAEGMGKNRVRRLLVGALSLFPIFAVRHSDTDKIFVSLRLFCGKSIRSMLYEFNGFRPVVHESAFIHPTAIVTGRVAIGRDVYIGPGAVLRGDWGRIEIADGCNVQENCVIHMFPGVAVELHESAHIGHGAIIHGAIIGRNSLIGMNAVVMDEAEIGPECIVGALSFVKAGEKIPARSLVAGNPARILREVSDEMLAWKTEGTRLYQQLPEQCRRSVRPCEPLREKPEGWEAEDASYRPWKSRTQ